MTQQLERAINKAMQISPRTERVTFSEFRVYGSKGDAYTVTTDRGYACNCPARSICYHIAHVAQLVEAEKLQVAAALERRGVAA